MHHHAALWYQDMECVLCSLPGAFKTCCQSKPYAGLDYPACGDVSLFFRQQDIFGAATDCAADCADV